jgi:uncharacterized protein YjbI with pentapeptide repeats
VRCNLSTIDESQTASNAGGAAMTREEAIELLKSGRAGVEKWNEWREANPGAELPDLSTADLSYANLSNANLSNADLSYANLSYADLGYANLGNADLSYAKLSDADLSYANLSYANLSYARLTFVNVRSALVDDANFSNSIFGHTILAGIDLSTAKGLEAAAHFGPSHISTDTLIRSQGKIPEAFLLGCGVPDSFIKYLPDLIGAMSPIEFDSCFISHSIKDKEFVDRLRARMRHEKMRVWYAPEDMKAGDFVHEQIIRAIHLNKRLLLVLSEKSMTSKWVATEIYAARQLEIKESRRVLFPIGLCDFDAIKKWTCFDSDSGQDVAKEIRRYLIPDFTDWENHDAFEKAFAKLLEGLKATTTIGKLE